MERDRVLRVLQDSIVELQVHSGLEPPEISGDTKPTELEEFDSLKCVELEVILSERLDHEIKGILVPDDSADVLTVSQLVDEILQAIERPNNNG